MKKAVLILSLCSSFGYAQTLPVRIPMAADTLVGITQEDYDVILFGFSYIKHLETINNITSNEVSRLDSINTYLNQQLSLERMKSAQKDTIIIANEQIVKGKDKELKKKKAESLAMKIGFPLIVVAVIAERLYREIHGY